MPPKLGLLLIYTGASFVGYLIGLGIRAVREDAAAWRRIREA